MVESGNISSGKKPQFFKFFIPAIHHLQLRIPREFLKHMESKSSGTVSLAGPTRKIWHVDLIKNIDDVFLHNGWEDFVRDHHIQVGYCLVFRYDGNLDFTVKIFDTSACEKKYDFNACNDTTGFCDHYKKKPRGNALMGLYDSSSKACNGSLKNPRGGDYHLEAGQALKTQHAVGQPLCMRPLNTTQTNMEILSLQVQPRFSSENVYWENYQKRKTCIKSNLETVGSQKRHIKTEATARALQNARSFNSKNNSFIVVIQRSHVHHGFYLAFPNSSLIRLALPEVSQSMTLYGPTGKAWEVRYIHGRGQKRSALSGGWKFFALGNNLKKGDVCVFEMIKSNKIQVHIFREVDYITPLINLC